jgi:hypothetical protein
MHERRQKAAEFRSRAALCLEVAERMSLREDRDRMIAMAQHFLTLAGQEEGKTD